MTNIFKRVWSKRSANSVSKSLRFPVPMLDMLEKQADDAGMTFNSFVVILLDQYLQAQGIEAAKQPEEAHDKSSG
jgi:hypothetical protein